MKKREFSSVLLLEDKRISCSQNYAIPAKIEAVSVQQRFHGWLCKPKRNLVVMQSYLSLFCIPSSLSCGRDEYNPLTCFGNAIIYSIITLINSNNLLTTLMSSVSICPGCTASFPVTLTISSDCCTMTRSPFFTSSFMSLLIFSPFSPNSLHSN